MTRFLFPPRPEKAIPVDLIPFYEKSGYLAQRKLNGTCTIIDVDVKGNSTFWTRHKELHKAWVAPDHIREYFSTFRDSVFVAELLHNKSPTVKNVLYIFDVLIDCGVDLVGTKLRDRLDLIADLPKADGIWIAETYTNNLVDLYNSLDDPIEEGIVLKNPNARLKFCFKDGANSDWQVKCRKSHKNYAF